jgi:hypothetical protein
MKRNSELGDVRRSRNGQSHLLLGVLENQRTSDAPVYPSKMFFKDSFFWSIIELLNCQNEHRYNGQGCVHFHQKGVPL